MNKRLHQAAPQGATALSVREYADSLRFEHALVDFTKACWRLVEPNAFSSNWHIDAICEHLEAAADWQINRLLINIPAHEVARRQRVLSSLGLGTRSEPEQ